MSVSWRVVLGELSQLGGELSQLGGLVPYGSDMHIQASVTGSRFIQPILLN